MFYVCVYITLHTVFVLDCGGRFWGPTGVISIPLRDSAETHRFSCQWLISADEGQGIMFTPKYFYPSSTGTLKCENWIRV